MALGGIYVYFVIKLQYVKTIIRCTPILKHQNDNKIRIETLIILVENNLRRSLWPFTQPYSSKFSWELGYTATLLVTCDITDCAKRTLTQDVEKGALSLPY